jgi:hypothetical protein
VHWIGILRGIEEEVGRRERGEEQQKTKQEIKEDHGRRSRVQPGITTLGSSSCMPYAPQGVKLRMYLTVSIFTKITNAPRNQESALEIEFQLNPSKHFINTGTRLRPSIIYDWRYSDFQETQVSLTIFV